VIRAFSSLRRVSVILMPGFVALAYGFAHLNWYLDTPLGQVPVLDEREQLNLAETIFRGLLPHEAFYRAPGYALVLAVFRALGTPATALFPAALAFGVVLHAINAVLIGRIARIWFNRRTGTVAGLLFALHPVFIHYSTQALDAVPALTLFLAGLTAVAGTFAKHSPPFHPWTRWLTASVFWATATLTRPNYFIVWLTLPLLAIFFAETPTRKRAVLAALGGVFVFAAMASWQYSVSGTAGFLPAQGAYNLWSANRPGSNGRFYSQQISLTGVGGQENPARVESALLFAAETGRPPADLDELNRHWRERFVGEVSLHPVTWSGLVVRKTYALLNDWEQYNNKTFAFHRDRSPWLHWNPISWGVVFVLAVVGLMRLRAENPRVVPALALLVLSVAASIVLFFVSARFRLPLAALLTLLGGAALAAPTFWRAAMRSGPGRFLAPIALVGALTFSRFDQVRDRTTFVQDHVLLARAADTAGQDATAWTEANAALAIFPTHPDANRIAVASFFNLLLQGRAPSAAEGRWVENCQQLLRSAADDAPDLQAIAALALWRTGDAVTALREWRALDQTPSAIAARILVNDAVSPTVLAQLPPQAWSLPLVQLAAAQTAIPAPAGTVKANWPDAAALSKRLFAVPH
jgi:4-amino-4-deoxy-L-arabinose transferase-like glycosyltransferase